MKNGYTYVLLRYRHDPLAGEVVNVGVVLHCAGAAFLGAKLRKTVGRLTKIFPDLEKSDLTNGLQVIERGIRRLRDNEASGLLRSLGDAAVYAKRVMPPEDSSFVWSDIGSGVTNNPTASLERLYSRFVARYDEEGRYARDDASVWQPVRDRLTERALIARLQPKTVISPIDRVEFEHAWKNGAWHCYQPLSFDLASADGIREKAARWSGHMTGLSKAEEPVRPHFIVGTPSRPELLDDYRRAIDLLRASALQPAVFEEAQADVLVDRIEDEMREHDAAR